METLRNEVFTPDVVWVVPGHGYFAGAKEGVDAVLQYFAAVFERSGGTLQVRLDDVLGGDDHCVSLHRDLATRDGRSLELRSVLVFDMVEGRIGRAKQYFDDPAVNDEFWA